MKTFVISFLILLLFCGTSYGFTDHRFVVKQDRNNILFIDSFPGEMNNIPEKNYSHFLACFTRKKGKWDSGILSGKMNCSIDKVNSAKLKVEKLMGALDKILPDDKKAVSFSYILCYHDSVIYFEHDYTMEELCLIAEKLNIERKEKKC